MRVVHVQDDANQRLTIYTERRRLAPGIDGTKYTLTHKQTIDAKKYRNIHTALVDRAITQSSYAGAFDPSSSNLRTVALSTYGGFGEGTNRFIEATLHHLGPGGTQHGINVNDEADFLQLQTSFKNMIRRRFSLDLARFLSIRTRDFFGDCRVRIAHTPNQTVRVANNGGSQWINRKEEVGAVPTKNTESESETTVLIQARAFIPQISRPTVVQYREGPRKSYNPVKLVLVQPVISS